MRLRSCLHCNLSGRGAAAAPVDRCGTVYGRCSGAPTRQVAVEAGPQAHRSPDWEPIRCPRDDVDRHAGLMPRKLSAGLLLYRRGNQDEEIVFEVLLAHMGGPFWARKDDGAWSIPKGEYELGEDPFVAAKREFEEELGSAPPLVVYRDLGSVSQPGGKLVTAWAAEADFDAAAQSVTPSNSSGPEDQVKCGRFQRLTRPGGSQ